MNKGTIQKLSDKGFGFIKVEGLAKALFFHASSLSGVHFNDLKEGDEVVFDEITTNEKGQSAIGIQLA